MMEIIKPKLVVYPSFLPHLKLLSPLLVIETYAQDEIFYLPKIL